MAVASSEMTIAVENGKEVTGKVQGAIGDVDTSTAGEMTEFLRAPVAGDRMIKILYALVMLACIGLFFFALATAAPTWAEPITSVQQIQVDSIPFPDVYMCYPHPFAALFADGFLDAEFVSGVSAQKPCTGLTAIPSLAQLGDPASQTCFMEKTETSGEFSISTVNPDKTKGTFTTIVNAKAKQLADLMPKIAGENTDIGPVCYAYPGNGKTIDDAGKHVYFAWSFTPRFDDIDSKPGGSFSKIMESGQSALLYLFPPGSEVVRDDKPIVEGTMFPAFGTISLASMEADKVKNELAGDKEYSWHYRPIVTSLLDSAGHFFQRGTKTYSDDSWTFASVFKIHSFTVTQIHIRAITFGEIWTQIGGLWGGSIFIMSLIFTTSGFVRNSDQRELLVFRYQSAKSKKEAIQNVGGVSKKVEDTQAEIMEMKTRMEELEGKIQALAKQ